MDSMDADRPERYFRSQVGIDEASKSVSDPVTGIGSVPRLIPPHLTSRDGKPSIYQRVIASLADIKHLMDGVSGQLDEIQLSDGQFTGDGETDKQFMLLRVERLLARLNVLSTAVANYGKQLSGSHLDPSLRSSRHYQTDLMAPELEATPYLGAALAVSDLRASLKNYKTELKKPGINNDRLSPQINDLVTRNAFLWYQVGGLESAVDELIRAESKPVTIDEVRSAIRRRGDAANNMGVIRRNWLRLQKFMLSGVDLCMVAFTVLDKIGDLTVRDCIGILEGAMHCIAPCARAVLGTPSQPILATERVLREQRAAEERLSLHRTLPHNNKTGSSDFSLPSRKNSSISTDQAKKPGRVVTDFTQEAQSKRLGKNTSASASHSLSGMEASEQTLTPRHRAYRRESVPPPVPKRKKKPASIIPAQRSSEVEVLSSALKVRLGAQDRKTASKVAKESFVRHFRNSIPPETFGPWLGMDVDSYVDQISSSVKEQADRTQLELTEARRRSVSSQGLHPNQEREVVHLEEKHAYLLDESREERVRERLSFYSPQPLSLDAVATQVTSINQSLIPIVNNVPYSGSPEELEESIEEKLNALRELKARIYELNGEDQPFGEALLEQIGNGFESVRLARIRLRSMYSNRMVDSKVCLNGIHDDLIKLYPVLVAEHPNSPRIVDIEKVLQWLQRDEQSDGFWMRLHFLLNRDGSNLKNVVFRYYATVVNQARIQAQPKYLQFNHQLACFRACSYEQWINLVQRYLADSEEHKTIARDAGFDSDAIAAGVSEELYRLAWRLDSIGEKLVHHCREGFEPEWTDSSTARFILDLLYQSQTTGMASLELLKQASVEIKLPLIKLAAENSPLFPPEAFEPFAADIPLTEISYRSLEKMARKILRKPSLNQEESIELSRIYQKILDELSRRFDGELLVLDGLLEDD